MTFKQFLEHNPQKIYGSMTSNPNGPSNTVGVHNDGNTKGDTGAFVSTAWSGSESNTEKPFVLPGVDLVKDNSPIEFVNGDIPRPNHPPKNPIDSKAPLEIASHGIYKFHKKIIVATPRNKKSDKKTTR